MFYDRSAVWSVVVGTTRREIALDPSLDAFPAGSVEVEGTVTHRRFAAAADAFSVVSVVVSPGWLVSSCGHGHSLRSQTVTGQIYLEEKCDARVRARIRGEPGT